MRIARDKNAGSGARVSAWIALADIFLLRARNIPDPINFIGWTETNRMNSTTPGWSRKEFLNSRDVGRLRTSLVGEALEQTKSNLDQETEPFAEASTRDTFTWVTKHTNEHFIQEDAGECYNEAISAVKGKIIFNRSAGLGWYRCQTRRGFTRQTDRCVPAGTFKRDDSSMSSWGNYTIARLVQHLPQARFGNVCEMRFV